MKRSIEGTKCLLRQVQQNCLSLMSEKDILHGPLIKLRILPVSAINRLHPHSAPLSPQSPVTLLRPALHQRPNILAPCPFLTTTHLAWNCHIPSIEPSFSLSATNYPPTLLPSPRNASQLCIIPLFTGIKTRTHSTPFSQQFIRPRTVTYSPDSGSAHILPLTLSASSRLAPTFSPAASQHSSSHSLTQSSLRFLISRLDHSFYILIPK